MINKFEEPIDVLLTEKKVGWKNIFKAVMAVLRARFIAERLPIAAYHLSVMMAYGKKLVKSENYFRIRQGLLHMKNCLNSEVCVVVKMDNAGRERLQ